MSYREIRSKQILMSRSNSLFLMFNAYILSVSSDFTEIMRSLGFHRTISVWKLKYEELSECFIFIYLDGKFPEAKL